MTTQQLQPGNIDMSARPNVKNADGSVSTVRSIGIELNGEHILIPTVSDDGRIMSNQEAIDTYKRTGKHLGKFASDSDADSAGVSLHNSEASRLGVPASFVPDAQVPSSFVPDAPVSSTPHVPVAGRGTGYDPANRPSNTEALKNNAPLIASIIAALVTDGASIPLQMGATAAGGAIGQGIKDTQWDMPTEQRIGNMFTEGLAQGALQGGASVVPGLIGKAGEAVYRGYLKPSLAGAEIGKARDVVNTAIREWLPITQGGIDKASRFIADINATVKQELRNATGTVDLSAIANKVRGFAQRVYNQPGVPASDFDAAMKVADDIDKHASLGLAPGGAGRIANPSAATAVQANDTKQALDKAIGDTGFGVERNAATEARKVGRFEARKAIEAIAPVEGLNKRESELIDAIDTLTHAVGREKNKSPLVGWSTLFSSTVGAGAGHALGDPSGGILSALVMRGLLEPAVASRAAILAAKFAKVPGTSVAQAIRMGALIAHRESQQKQEQPNGGK